MQCKDQTDSFLAFPSDKSWGCDCSMVFRPEDRVSALILEKQALTVTPDSSPFKRGSFWSQHKTPLGMRGPPVTRSFEGASPLSRAPRIL